jgi:hypothetical protein
LSAVIKSRMPAPPIERLDSSPVKIAAGGTTQVIFKAARRPMLEKLQLNLSQPPQGLTLQDVNVVPEGLALQFKADKNMKIGFTDNLIVEMSAEVTPKQENGKTNDQKRVISLGVLPAIPIEIVQNTK